MDQDQLMAMDRSTEEIDAGGLRQMMRQALEAALGHTFANRVLLQRALTHRSYANERGDDGPGSNYERLEFLGDAVLGLVASQWLFRKFGDQPEGELSRRKGFLVSAPALSGYARELGVGPLLRLGVGEERSGGRAKASILADVLEALFGAVYLDGGLPAAHKVILPLLERAHEDHEQGPTHDAKTRLQERLQARGRSLPTYHLVAEAGPDHAKTFTVDCFVDGRRAGTGKGSSKKVAEQAAAEAALDTLDLDPSQAEP